MGIENKHVAFGIVLLCLAFICHEANGAAEESSKASAYPAYQTFYPRPLVGSIPSRNTPPPSSTDADADGEGPTASTQNV